MTTIAANAGSTISSTTQLSVASVTCTGDIQGRDISATRELHVDGAAFCNSTLTVAGVDVMTALAAKQNALTASSALSCSTLSASGTISMSGGGDFGGPLLRLYSPSTQGSAIEFGQGSARTFHIQQSTSTLQFWRSLYNTQAMQISNAGYVHFFAGYGSASDQRLKTPNPPAASTADAIAICSTEDVFSTGSARHWNVKARVRRPGDRISMPKRLGQPHQHGAAFHGAWRCSD